MKDGSRLKSSDAITQLFNVVRDAGLTMTFHGKRVADADELTRLALGSSMTRLGKTKKRKVRRAT